MWKGPLDVLFWVGNPSPLQVVAEINEEDITKIALGQIAYLASEAFPGQSLTARVGPAKSSLRQQLSAVLRNRLIGQLKEIHSAEEAAIWTRVLPAKNPLETQMRANSRMRSRPDWQSYTAGETIRRYY
jgi:hypothetical protein